MSRSFDGTGDRLDGVLTTGLTYPFSLGAWIKGTHQAAVDRVLSLFATAGSNNDAVDLRLHSAANTYRFVSTNAAASAQSGSVTQNIDGVWTAIVGIQTGDSFRIVYLGTPATNGTDVNPIVVGTLTRVRLGMSPAASNDYLGLIAEAAIWNFDISSNSTLADYMSGVNALYCATTPVAYWPFADTDLLNLGTDSGGDLTATNTTFDADHPVITIPSSVSVGRRIYVLP